MAKHTKPSKHLLKFRLRAEEKTVQKSDRCSIHKPIHEFIISKIDLETNVEEDIIRSQDLHELTFLLEQDDLILDIDNDLMEYWISQEQTRDTIRET